MGRPPRAADGGLIDHPLNHANAPLAIFDDDDGDAAAFQRVLAEAVARQDIRLLACCAMPKHFHLVVWPHAGGDLSRFLRWLTMTHTQRWHAHRRSAGTGHLYQGRSGVACRAVALGPPSSARHPGFGPRIDAKPLAHRLLFGLGRAGPHAAEPAEGGGAALVAPGWSAGWGIRLAGEERESVGAHLDPPAPGTTAPDPFFACFAPFRKSPRPPESQS